MPELRDRRRRNGQVLAIAPILFVAVVALSALAVDLGRIGVERARLQAACDAASLAGAHVLLSARIDGLSELQARQAAEAAATSIFRANCDSAALTIRFGHVASDAFVADDESTPASAVRVDARRDADAPGGRLALVFAPALGLDACNVSASAAAEISVNISGVLAGAAPFAVPADAIPAPGEEMVFYPSDEENPQITPGTWGLLNLNGGALGVDELLDWIKNGYPSAVSLDPELGYIWIDGTTGFRAALQEAISARIGEPILLIVYDQITGTGSNANFRCVGFVRLVVTGCRLTGNDPYISGRVAELSTLHDIITGTAWPSPNILKVQLVL